MIIGHAHPKDLIEFSVDGWGIGVGAKFLFNDLGHKA